MPASPATDQFLALEPRLHLSAVYWDGGGDDTSWADPHNWSGDVLPGPADDVTINHPSTHPTVVHASSDTARVRSLFCTEALVLSAGGIETTSGWRQSGLLRLAGGTIGGQGNLTLSGPCLWTSGTIAPGGLAQVLPGATLTINGNVLLGRTLVNNSVLSLQGSLWLTAGALLNNLAGNTWTISGGVQGGASSAIQNGGVIVSNGANLGVPVLATSVNAELRAQAVTNLTGAQPHLGRTTISSGAALTLHQGGAIIQGVQVSGGGTLQVLSPTTISSPLVNLGTLICRSSLDLRADCAVGDFTLTGTLAGPGRLTVSHSLAWSGGVMEGSGETRLLSSATLTVSDATLSRRLRVAGHSDWWGTSTFRAGTLTLEPGALMTASGRFLDDGGGSIIYNGGTINAGAGTALDLQVRVFFTTPAASLNVVGSSASLYYLPNTTHLTVAAGTTLKLYGPTKLIAGGSITGAGTVIFQGGRHTLAGALNTTGDVRLPFGSIVNLMAGGTVGALTMQGGLLTGAGLTISQPTGLLFEAGTLAGIGFINTPAATLTGIRGPCFLSCGLNIAGEARLTSGLVLWISSTTLRTGPGGHFVVDPGPVSIRGSGMLETPSLMTVTGTLDAGASIIFDNTGTLDVTGAASFAGGIVQLTDNTLTAGVWHIAGTLALSSPITRNDTIVQLSGPGAHVPALETLAQNTGSLTLDAGATLALAGSLANSGDLTLDLSLLAIAGDFSQTAAGSLTIGARAAGATGTLSVAGTATLDGALILLTSGTPAYQPNTPILFLSAASVTGQFATTDFSGLASIPAGTSPHLEYLASQVRFEFI